MCCRSLARCADLESLLVDWERVKFVHCNWTLRLRILQGHSNNSSYLVFLVLVKLAFVWYHDFLSISVQRILQLVILELSSLLPFRAYYSFESPEKLSLS